MTNCFPSVHQRFSASPEPVRRPGSNAVRRGFEAGETVLHAVVVAVFPAGVKPCEVAAPADGQTDHREHDDPIRWRTRREQATDGFPGLEERFQACARALGGGPELLVQFDRPPPVVALGGDGHSGTPALDPKLGDDAVGRERPQPIQHGPLPPRRGRRCRRPQVKRHRTAGPDRLRFGLGAAIGLLPLAAALVHDVGSHTRALGNNTNSLYAKLVFVSVVFSATIVF